MTELLTAPEPAKTPSAVAGISATEVNKLLALPEDERFHLAWLLNNSVRENFTSLEEVERRDREELHRRVQAVVNGEVELLDGPSTLDKIEKVFREKHAR